MNVVLMIIRTVQIDLKKKESTVRVYVTGLDKLRF